MNEWFMPIYKSTSQYQVVSGKNRNTYVIGRHGRNSKGVVRRGGDGWSPGITPSADTPPLRRRRRPLMPMVLLLLEMVVVALIAGHAASSSAAARRVGGRGGRRQPRRLASALHAPALFLPHSNLGTKSKFNGVPDPDLSQRRSAGSFRSPAPTNNTSFL